MTFLIITQVAHKYHQGTYYSYAPYVKEMNLWLKYTDKVLVIAPIHNESPGEIDLPYSHPAIVFIPVKEFNLRNLNSILNSISIIPGIFWKCVQTIKRSEHIHLRCPGNMGLLGCVAQFFFPSKIKTAKYAGNWDKNSIQPWSYRLQRWILNNTFLTRNMKTLVYGNWAATSKNILPFFTATYNEADKEATFSRDLSGPIKLIFAGSLVKGKQPLLSCIVIRQLLQKGIVASLDLYGEGPERKRIEKFVSDYNLQENIYLHGNQKGEILKTAYKQSHFLVFISESEGWPKAVAEAMWWGCLPITTPVSCVPQMVNYGERGELVKSDATEIVDKIVNHINHPEQYKTKCIAAMKWSRAYTLERFEKEIKGLIHS